MDFKIDTVYFIHTVIIMFSEEVKKLLIQVISSWQVLLATGILIVYIFIVKGVARTYHRRPPPPPKVKSKPNNSAAPSSAPSENDELGLEEGSGGK